MPLFKRNDLKLKSLKVVNFKTEKELQTLIEKNLDTVFNCQFVATEFSTGKEHSGRIDSLALSEDGNPVIIEYKKNKSRELITQSLYDLFWLNDHQGDFKVAVDNQLGHKTEINWDAIRVICIAPSYSKFDLHAVKSMRANIELWQYKLFEDGSIYFEDILRRESNRLNDFGDADLGKNPVMVATGEKTAITRATGKCEFKEAGKDFIKSISAKEIWVEKTVCFVPSKFQNKYELIGDGWRGNHPFVFWYQREKEKKLKIILEIGPFRDGEKRQAFLSHLKEYNLPKSDKTLKLNKESKTIFSDYSAFDGWDSKESIIEKMDDLYNSTDAKEAEANLLEACSTFLWKDN